MIFDPQAFLGKELPNLISSLARVDPNLLPQPDQGRVQLYHALLDRETQEALTLRPQAELSTLIDAHLPFEHPDITVPDVVLESYLGGGSQGWVYAGQVRSTGKVVAVKVIRSDFEETRKAVAREVKICGRIRHYNVMRVFEMQSAGAFWVVLMELVQGEQLGRKPLPAESFKPCFAALADAVAALGESGIVHRDIKPANILLRSYDGSPVLVDFGLAFDLEQAEAEDSGSLCGTPLFMAPEAFLRGQRPQPSWDVYALGMTAALLLLGRIPYADSLDTIWESKRSGQFQHSLHHTLESIRDPEVRDWVRLMTASQPGDRRQGLELARRWRAA